MASWWEWGDQPRAPNHLAKPSGSSAASVVAGVAALSVHRADWLPMLIGSIGSLDPEQAFDTLAESYTGAARFLRDTKKLLSH